MQQLKQGRPDSLETAAWVVGLRMGGGNAVSSEVAEEVRNSGATCMRYSYSSAHCEHEAFTGSCSDTGAIDVAHLPPNSRCYALVITKEKYCSVLGTAAGVPWLNTSFSLLEFLTH